MANLIDSEHDHLADLWARLHSGEPMTLDELSELQQSLLNVRVFLQSSPGCDIDVTERQIRQYIEVLDFPTTQRSFE